MSILNITSVYPLDDIKNINICSLAEAGFEVVTFDLDKTIIGQYDEKLTDDRKIFFEKLGRTTIKAAIASNAFGDRIGRVRRMALKVGESMGRDCMSVVPDDVNGVKKPHSDMLRYVLEKFDVDSPYNAVHVGDQIRSDVVAAEGAGFRAAILVRPTGEGDDLTVKYVGRPVIEPWMRHRRGLPRLDKFPSQLPDEFYQAGY